MGGGKGVSGKWKDESGELDGIAFGSRVSRRKQSLLFKFLFGRKAPIFLFVEKHKNLQPKCFKSFFFR